MIGRRGDWLAVCIRSWLPWPCRWRRHQSTYPKTQRQLCQNFSSRHHEKELLPLPQDQFRFAHSKSSRNDWNVWSLMCAINMVFSTNIEWDKLKFPIRFTPVLNWMVVLKSVKECNIHMPYHFGILKVYSFQKVTSKKNSKSFLRKWQNSIFILRKKPKLSYMIL